MEIEEVSNSDMKEVEVTSLDPKDMRNLTKSRYAFDWKKPYKESLVFVLRIKGAQDILGAMAIVKFPSELRYEVKLLATSRENVGKNKIYEGIAGCLLSFACRECIREYGYLACVSLIPKTELRDHYIRKYNMSEGGAQVYLDSKSLVDLINRY
jgi:hypothetical protein